MQNLGGGKKCPRCSKAVYFAEEVRIENSVYHKLCFVCGECNKGLDKGSAILKNGLLCKTCYGRSYGPKGYGYGAGAGTLNMDVSENYQGEAKKTSSDVSPSTGAKSKFGQGSELCGRCGKAVYLAEKVSAIGKAFHKSCFNCKICNKKLDSTNVANKGDQIFCKSCYGKEFGPKGFGYGVGAGALGHTQ